MNVLIFRLMFYFGLVIEVYINQICNINIKVALDKKFDGSCARLFLTLRPESRMFLYEEGKSV